MKRFKIERKLLITHFHVLKNRQTLFCAAPNSPSRFNKPPIPAGLVKLSQGALNRGFVRILNFNMKNMFVGTARSKTYITTICYYYLLLMQTVRYVDRVHIK